MAERSVGRVFGIAASMVMLLAGCWGPQSPPPAPPAVASGGQQSAAETLPSKPPAEWTAGEILQRLLATYRSAQTYQDQGVVRLAYRQDGQPVSREEPARVAFERPGKLSLAAYQAIVKCDGQSLRARIEDPDSRNIDGQVLVRPAPRELKLTDLAGDALLYDTISSELRRQPIQLELLLESSGLVSAFGADVACRRLEDETHEARPCFRVEVPSPGGAFVFWVDQAQWLLRRLDYPAAALLPALANDPAVSDLQLLADMRGATIGATIPAEQFVLEIPAGAKRMKSFVIPPPPLPSNLFGRQPPEFSFVDLEGKAVGAKELAGKPAVLVWYHDNPACEATLQQVSLARQRLKDSAALLAVATDPTTTDNAAVARRLAEWKVELPVARDLEAFGDKAFRIQVQPTIVVLDPQGRVQIYQPGGNPELADQLVTIVQRLSRGDDLATELLERRAREQQQYEQLVAKGGEEPSQVVELPEAVIRRRTEPKQLKLQQLWTCSELKSPGNLLVVESEGQPPRIFVFEGWRTIAEVDAQGKIAGRHALAIPERAAVALLRTATAKDGQRYFAVSAPLAPQVFVFDGDWKLVLTHPPPGETPLAVLDLAFADLGQADGTPDLLVASVADQGLAAVSLKGEQLWRNRAFPNVVSAAVTLPNDAGSWGILLTGESGAILRVNGYGHEDPPAQVAGRQVLSLIAGRFPSAKQAALLALAGGERGERLAVGLTSNLKEAWNYPLPAGVHARPIEPVAPGRVLPGREGEWWLAAPDGSIHVVSEDGDFFDSFYYGEVLTGLAAAKLNQRPALLIATDAGLSAWEVAAPLPRPATRER